MKMTICAGVVTLAALCLFVAVPAAQARDMMESSVPAQTASIDVVRIKNALHLTPAQERYWAPVEAALRELARRQARDANEGLVRRIGQRVVQIALNSATIHRLAAAARPLVKTFDEQQMQTAHGLAQEMGFGPVVAALK
jgi:hypothetical protein